PSRPGHTHNRPRTRISSPTTRPNSFRWGPRTRWPLAIRANSWYSARTERGAVSCAAATEPPCPSTTAARRTAWAGRHSTATTRPWARSGSTSPEGYRRTAEAGPARSGFELVPQAAHGHQVFGPGRIGFDLRPQPFDVHIESLGLADVVRT